MGDDEGGWKKAMPVLLIMLVMPVLVLLVNTSKKYIGKAKGIPADIVVDSARVVGPLPHTWKALAQGGEEKGVRMLENVVPAVAELAPRYIRIDHIYDYYDVVPPRRDGKLAFDWTKLDETVCDILRTGAKPFFSLGYMPPLLSSDGSLISVPVKWDDWSLLVQSTIEHYSSQNPHICGLILDRNLTNVYYEVWNEPDLETFGKWSIYGGPKDYRLLYYYSAKGAASAQNIQQFYLGGPAITAPYKNWFTGFLDYITAYNVRLDFLSWHHYSKVPDDFTKDMTDINVWLADPKYASYRSLPRIISEWAFDSNPNPLSETNIAAAHTVAAIRNLIEQKLEMAFAFEIKDGRDPRWGIFSYTGEKKPRYDALAMLNNLGRNRLLLSGEGTNVRAIASLEFGKIAVIVVNYDLDNVNEEMASVTVINLAPGNYRLILQQAGGEPIELSETVGPDGRLFKQLILKPNAIYLLELNKL